MEDCLKVTNIKIKNNRIEYDYEIEGKWKQVLNEDEKMWIECGESLEEKVPESIAVIPLLCNILPISWVLNLKISVKKLDKTFYESIPKIKEGYIKMYPKMELLGNIEVDKIEKNENEKKGVGALFSGGIDSLNTLFKHIEEKPTLFTVWGADIKIEDKKGWEKVDKHSKNIAKRYGLNYEFIKSNFKIFLKETELNKIIRQKIEGGWWHEFQHGIGMLGNFAPLAYKNNMKIIYIASSLAKDCLGKYTCASDPTIDNNLHFASCKVIHDGCEFSRQQKIKNICDYLDKSKEKSIPARVCWISEGGDNCCECEKCYRTILGIIAEKKDPNDFGFNLTEEKRKKMMERMPKINQVKYNFQNYYSEIQEAFLKNYTEEETPEDLVWFRNFKLKNKEPLYISIIKKLKKILRRIKN